MMMYRQMASWCRWPWLVITVILVLMLEPARADPQIEMINLRCSAYSSSDPGFQLSVNASFSDLRNQLVNETKYFATAQQSRSSDAVYALVQCRRYLSSADCLTCYDTAAARIRNTCVPALGADAIYAGCYLRYETHNFFREPTNIETGNGQRCGSQQESQTTTFTAEAEKFLKELEIATPRTNNYFAADKRELSGGAETVYAVAQCIETLPQTGCQDCLAAVYTNIHFCLPSTGGSGYDSGCFLRYSTTSFFADNQTVDIAPFLRSGRSSKSKVIIGGVSAGIGLLLAVLALYIWYLFLRKRLASRKGDILEVTEFQGPLNYDYKDLKSATKNFHEENKLGEGGFGEVFKGTLKNGNVVAVKKLTVSSARAKAEFDAEVRLISNVHHRNVLRLLGRSSNGAQLLLVYEFMKNGSLDIFLYGPKRGTLNWKQRRDIISGTARGLAYLHEQFHISIIHRDMKSNNILLDEDLQPKIADFGLARLLPGGQSHLTTRFAGTLGYTAPEYALFGHLSEKVDTYSFGVVILEIISGRRSTDVKLEPGAKFLLEEAWKLHEKNMHLSLVDETLDPDDYKPEEMRKFIGIALSCTQSPASARPTMSEVVAMLSSDEYQEQHSLSKPTAIN